MATRRKAEKTNPFGIKPPLLCMMPDQAHRSLYILQRGIVFLAAFATGHSILEHHAGDAD